jgi:hypothetical protein
MANGLSISSDLDKPRVFECPNCKQTIDTSSRECRFCSATIDPADAEAAAAKMARINRACSDASYLKIAALCIPAFLLIYLVPFMGLLGVVGVIFLEIAIPIWILLWCFRFLSIRSEDPDFRSAKKTVVIVAIVWVVLVGLRFIT